jgi:general stress protein 26
MKKLLALSLMSMFASGVVGTADEAKPVKDKAAILAAAREVMGAQKYCALVTLDESGKPQVRTMNPFPPDEDMVVWMATNTRSRKVAQIRKDARVALYYANHENAIGSVMIEGRAELTEDMAEIQKRKRAYWDQAFPGLKNLTLVKVIPERIEVINYKAGLNNDPETFGAPSVEMTQPKKAEPTEPKK